MLEKRYDETTSGRIAKAAYQLLSERGYVNVSLRDIALRAEVSVSQIAYHFGSKEKLIAEVVGGVAERCADELEKLLGAARPWQEKLEIVREYFRSLHKDNEALFRVLLDFMAQSIWIPGYRERISGFFRRVGAMISDDTAERPDEDERFSRETVRNMILNSMIGTTVQTALGVDNVFETDDDTEDAAQPLPTLA